MQHLIAEFPEIILNFSTVGLLAVDKRFNIILWNRFMEIHSRMKADEVLGRNIFACFPELNRQWLEKKIKTVMVLKNASFTSWKQRPHLFNFQNTQPITGEITSMYQDCSFWVIQDKTQVVRGVCISVHDMTETAVAQRMLYEITEEALTLEETSQRDGLTGLFNRAYFDEQISQEIQRARRYEWSTALIMLDIDFFKKVNDTYGHPGGDAVLKELALILNRQLRGTDIICRYGGEEFSIILPQIERKMMPHICRRLLDTVECTPVTYESSKIKITISMGYSFYEKGVLPGELIAQADKALYQSKEGGRNRATEYQKEV